MKKQRHFRQFFSFGKPLWYLKFDKIQYNFAKLWLHNIPTFVWIIIVVGITNFEEMTCMLLEDRYANVVFLLEITLINTNLKVVSLNNTHLRNFPVYCNEILNKIMRIIAPSWIQFSCLCDFWFLRKRKESKIKFEFRNDVFAK